MYDNLKVVVIIPARGGSKRLPEKHTKILNGKPMISYAIDAAIKSQHADRVIVSTDSNKIARMARQDGAEVPFMRPLELAIDTATSLSVLHHAVRFLDYNRFKTDLIVLVQATSPLVVSDDIDGAVQKLIFEKTNSCVSVCEVSQRPEWMYKLDQNPPELFLETKNLPGRSQDLPRLGILNGAIYVMRYRTLMEEGLIRDPKSLSLYLMPRERSVDVDDLHDFELAEFWMKKLYPRVQT